MTAPVSRVPTFTDAQQRSGPFQNLLVDKICLWVRVTKMRPLYGGTGS